MNIKNYLSLIAVLLTLACSNSACYSQKWMWADKIGLDTGGNDYGMAMTKDGQGNVYITGRVKGNSTFGTGAGAVTLIGYGDRDVFVSKYDSLGNFIWARRYGGLSSDYGLGIATDSSSNIYVTGYFTDSVKFGAINIIGTGGQDIFVAKLDVSGSLLWVKTIGGTTNEYANAIAVDKSGNAFISGAFTGTVVFGPNTLVSTGGIDYFISKFDANGNCIWARRTGNTLNDEGKSVVINKNGTSLYVCGYYNGSVTFGTTVLAGYSGNDIFVAKYDTTGTCLWAKRAGSSNHEFASAVALDNTGSLYITGNYVAAVNFGTTTSPVMIPAATGGQDVFLAKYDTLGNITWAKKAAGGSGIDNSQGIVVNQFNNPVFCGFFETTCSFDGVSKTVEGGSRDVFATEYDATGSVLWVKTYKGVMKSGIYASGHAVIVDNTQHAYLTGGFLDTVSFDAITLISSGITSDVFLGKLSPYVKASFSQTSTTVCKGSTVTFTDGSRGGTLTYNWFFEGAAVPNYSVANPIVQYDTAGTFDVQLIINNGFEADTLLLSNFITVLNPPLISVGNDTTVCIGSTLVLNPGSGFSSYLWQDGSVTSTFAASSTGQYYVEVTDINTCTASDTVNLVFDLCTSVTDPGANAGAGVYPNPVSTSSFVVYVNDRSDRLVSFELYDVTGKAVLNLRKINTAEIQVNVSILARGVYSYIVNTEKGAPVHGKIVIY